MHNRSRSMRSGILAACILLGLMVAAPSQGATTYKGTIKDTTVSSNLDSVLVKIKGTSIQAYTNSLGKFTITNPASAVHFSLLSSTKSAGLRFNSVSRTISWQGNHVVRFTVFNALGAVVAISQPFIGAGSYALPRLTNSVYFLKTEFDGKSSLGKITVTGDNITGVGPAADASVRTSGKAAKTAGVAKDTLVFSKAHYYGKQQAVSAGDTNLTIKLAKYSSKPNLTLISPNGGETFKVGDSLTIKWRANPDSVVGMLFSITFNAGLKYWYVKDESSIQSGHGLDTAITWKIPDSLYDIGNDVMVPVPASTQCKVRMSDYQVRYTVFSAANFSVTH